MQHRYLTLDAARGVAALSVVIMHIQPVLMPGKWMRSGSLAVDFFFALSGFVLAFAYQSRLGSELTTKAFLYLRLVRLYPLFLLGGLISLALTALMYVRGNARLSDLGASLINFAFIPVPAFHLYPLNFPAWSLALELLVNVLFAAFAVRLRSRAILASVIAIAWVGLVVTGLKLHAVDGGVHNYDWWGGLPRVGFSFFLGVALFRLQDGWSFSVPGWASIPMLALLVLSFCIDGNVFYDLFAVSLIYPALILLGSRITVPAPAVAAFLGDISYAIYILHIPVRRVVKALMDQFGVAPATMIGAAFVVIIVISAALADRFFDRPVRRFLAGRFKPRPAG